MDSRRAEGSVLLEESEPDAGVEALLGVDPDVGVEPVGVTLDEVPGPVVDGVPDVGPVAPGPDPIEEEDPTPGLGAPVGAVDPGAPVAGPVAPAGPAATPGVGVAAGVPVVASDPVEPDVEAPATSGPLVEPGAPDVSLAAAGALGVPGDD
ncbi:MAG: hypothetical protein ACRDT1_05055 [Micromonosporaceae bacterium]